MQVCQVSASSSLRFLRRRILNIFRKQNFTMLVKLVLISDTYCILMIAIPLLLRQKKEQTDPGAPQWTMLTLNSPSV